MEEQDQRAGSQSGLKTNIKFTTKHRTIEDLTLNPDCHSGSDYDENLNVMKFAELTQEVQIERAKEVRWDNGLTPGRRRANQVSNSLLKPF